MRLPKKPVIEAFMLLTSRHPDIMKDPAWMEIVDALGAAVRRCAWCEGEFVSASPRNIYCHADCRRQAENARVATKMKAQRQWIRERKQKERMSL